MIFHFLNPLFKFLFSQSSFPLKSSLIPVNSLKFSFRNSHQCDFLFSFLFLIHDCFYTHSSLFNVFIVLLSKDYFHMSFGFFNQLLSDFIIDLTVTLLHVIHDHYPLSFVISLKHFKIYYCILSIFYSSSYRSCLIIDFMNKKSNRKITQEILWI
jgi:hypothetical protein